MFRASLASLGLVAVGAFSGCGEQGPLSVLELGLPVAAALSVSVLGLPVAGATARLGARAPCCSGSSCRAAQALGRVGFSSCAVCGMWELPGPGIEPMSPALAGGSPSAAPPGTSRQRFLKCLLYVLFLVGARHVLGDRK